MCISSEGHNAEQGDEDQSVAGHSPQVQGRFERLRGQQALERISDSSTKKAAAAVESTVREIHGSRGAVDFEEQHESSTQKTAAAVESSSEDDHGSHVSAQVASGSRGCGITDGDEALHYMLWEGGCASRLADDFPCACEGICR